MKNYITLYENTFSSEECNELIKKFEDNSPLHELESITSSDGWHMQFTQLKLAKHEVFEAENQKLRTLFLEAISIYKKEHGIETHQWPEKFMLEPIRMKRYLPNTDERFDEHVEVTNLKTAKRFMVVLIYLNDDFTGGETDFPQFNIKVKPKQGNMVLFPAMWNWLHKGYPVKGENPKYIVGTMMHYV
jgi:2OG-Fe(II) oxygenase superfamily